MTETVTGGDLYSLWRVSDVHLPRIADVYYDANRELARAAYSGAEMTESVGAAWMELCDELQVMYAQVGTTILVAADGLRKATRAFVDADMASADALEKYRSDPTNHPTGRESNPPAKGDDDHPGQPILPSSGPRSSGRGTH